VNLHAEIIDLASEGFFYPSGSVLASGKVGILPITAEHEELLSSPNLIKRGIVEKELLNAVVEGGVDYETLLDCDRQSILLNLRIVNYGAMTKIKTACSECDAEFEHDISFGFRGRNFDFSKYTRGVNHLTYTFPKCKKMVHFRLGTCSEHVIYEKQSWLAFAKSITINIDGANNINDFYDYELNATDSTLFRKYYENNTPGYINEIEITCPTCKNVKKSKMDVNYEIFGVRPESRMAIHSEIFDLCYYSNGAFTQDGVYKMPTNLRTFYIKKLVDAKKAEADAQKKANKGESPNSKIAKPPKVK